jgi:hypothetical protein
MKPPYWSELLLRWFLIDRDRDTVSGDLLEEYREVAVATRGPRGARWWYRRQAAGCVWRSLRLPTMIGLSIGAVLGLVNLIGTARWPLADDDALTMLAWIVALLAMWSAAVVFLTRGTRHLAHAVIVGAILGVATMLVFDATAIVRVNVFLDAIRHRDDWQNLLVRYQNSGFRSLRAYANYEYAIGTPMVIALGTIAGAISGGVGGLLRSVRRAYRPFGNR